MMMQGIMVLFLYFIWTSCVTIGHSESHNAHHHHRKHSSRHSDSDTQQLSGSGCGNNFQIHLGKCMDPFSKKAPIYITTHPQNPLVREIFIKHVCRRYKKMLHCIHLILSNCQTRENLETVHQKLENNWVTHINKMCNIQVGSSSTGEHTGDIKGHNSRDTPISSTGTSVTQTEYYNMKSQDFHHTRNKGRNNGNRKNIAQEGSEQFQQFGTKLIQPDQLAELSDKNIPRLITYIKYNVILGQKNIAEKNGLQSSVTIDQKYNTENDRLKSNAESNSVKPFLKEGQKPVMVQILYVDTNEESDRHSTSSQTAAVSGTSKLRHNSNIVLFIILSVVLMF